MLIATKVKEELRSNLLEEDEEEKSTVARVWDLPVYTMAGVFLSFGSLLACVTLWNKLNAAMRHRDMLQVCGRMCVLMHASDRPACVVRLLSGALFSFFRANAHPARTHACLYAMAPLQCAVPAGGMGAAHTCDPGSR